MCKAELYSSVELTGNFPVIHTFLLEDVDLLKHKSFLEIHQFCLGLHPKKENSSV